MNTTDAQQATSTEWPARSAPEQSLWVRRLMSYLAPPALFLLLSAIFLWQPLLTGKVFLPTDMVFKYDQLWSLQPGASEQVAQNTLLSDVAVYYYPYADFAINRLRSGHFPLWNPYILTGTPFFASTQAAVLEPVNLLAFLAGPEAYWTWAALLRIALLGFTTFGLVRALGRGVAGSIASGVVFMVCGFVAVWLNYSVVWTLAWLPGLMWATTRLLQTKQPVWMAATAAAIAGLLLGGHPETQFLVGLTWGAYCLYSLLFIRWQGERLADALRASALLAGGALLGLVASSVQTLTFVDLLQRSNAMVDRIFAVPPFDLRSTLIAAAALFFPNFTGNPVDGDYWVRGNTNFNEQTGYIGLLTLVLAVLGLVRWWRRDRVVPFLAVSALLALLLSIDAPVLSEIRSLPLLNVGHGVRWVVIPGFFGAVLAGYGVDALIEMRERSHILRDTGFLLLSVALAGLGVLLVCYLGIRDSSWERSWHAQLSHVSMARLFHPATLTLYWPVIFLAAGAALVLARWRGWLGARTMPVLLIVLLYADLWTFGNRYNPVTPAATIFPQLQTTRYLARNLGHDRFVGTAHTLMPNICMTMQMHDLRGYEDVVDQPLARVYADVNDAMNASRKKDLDLTPDEHHLLQMAGVRYMLAAQKPSVAGSRRPYKFLFQEGRLATFENLDALPRAYAVFDSVFVPDQATATRFRQSANFDPARTVILEGQGQGLAGSTLDAKSVRVDWVRDDPEDVELHASMPRPGYVVLSDDYAPGWEALLDGRPVPVLRANQVFRGVAVPRGEHTVSFQYRPALFYYTAALSLAATLVILFIAVAHLVAAVRRSTRQ